MHFGTSYLLKHCMLHGVDEIVGVCISYTMSRLPWQRSICMILCHASIMGYICNRHIFCCQKFTGKSTMWWMFFWSVMVNIFIRLDNDWSHKYEPHLKQCLSVTYDNVNRSTAHMLLINVRSSENVGHTYSNCIKFKQFVKSQLCYM